MTFRIGQKVVCVHAVTAQQYLRHCPNLPTKGGVYTVRAVQMVEGETGLLLEEVVNPPFEWANAPFSEHGFHHLFFRPAKTTDIGIFTAMLKPTRIGASA